MTAFIMQISWDYEQIMINLITAVMDYDSSKCNLVNSNIYLLLTVWIHLTSECCISCKICFGIFPRFVFQSHMWNKIFIQFLWNELCSTCDASNKEQIKNTWTNICTQKCILFLMQQRYCYSRMLIASSRWNRSQKLIRILSPFSIREFID